MNWAIPEGEQKVMSNRRLVLVSFLVTSVCGAVFLVAYWSHERQPVQGMLRSAIFVALMAGAHMLVWRYASRMGLVEEGQAGAPARVDGAAGRLAPEYTPALKVAALQQLVLIVLSSLLLDGGYGFRICLIAAAAHWALMLIVALRRPISPTRLDLGAVRYGFLVLVILTGAIASGYGRMFHA